jgi:hypothetical protein
MPRKEIKRNTQHRTSLAGFGLLRTLLNSPLISIVGDFRSYKIENVIRALRIDGGKEIPPESKL